MLTRQDPCLGWGCRKLRTLKVCNNPGPDNLHPWILREAATVLCRPLGILFPQIFRGRLSTWRLEVCAYHATFKKRKRHSPINYRPVSLTAVTCKILDALIRDAIMTYLGNSGVLSQDQHGFIKGRSCMTLLVETLEKWSHWFDEGQCVDNFYLDLSKAFDRVPHQHLLSKLRTYGICEFKMCLHGWNPFWQGRSRECVRMGRYHPGKLSLAVSLREVWWERPYSLYTSTICPMWWKVWLNYLQKTLRCSGSSRKPWTVRLFKEIWIDFRTDRELGNWHLMQRRANSYDWDVQALDSNMKWSITQACQYW